MLGQLGEYHGTEKLQSRCLRLHLRRQPPIIVMTLGILYSSIIPLLADSKWNPSLFRII